MQDNCHSNVTLTFYCRNSEKANEINTERTLKSVTTLVKFNETIKATTSVEECTKGADFIFLCIPAQTLSKFFEENSKYFDKQSIFVNCAKGMSIEQRKFISQIFSDKFPDRMDKYTVLSGPSFADEMFKKMPTLVTIAGTNQQSIDMYISN